MIRAKATLVTLGPSGTCHERAARAYMEFQGVDSYEFEFIEDFFDGLERIRGREDAFLIQCSAHPLVHKVTERYWDEVFVVDTFIYPTKALAVLSRREVEKPRTLGLVPATAGYIDEGDWEEIVDVASKPIVARELLEGRYEAGLTHLEHAERHPRATPRRPGDRRNRHDLGRLRNAEAVPGRGHRYPLAGAVPTAGDRLAPRH